jgi:hypothetical protein
MGLDPGRRAEAVPGNVGAADAGGAGVGGPSARLSISERGVGAPFTPPVHAAARDSSARSSGRRGRAGASRRVPQPAAGAGEEPRLRDELPSELGVTASLYGRRPIQSPFQSAPIAPAAPSISSEGRSGRAQPALRVPAPLKPGSEQEGHRPAEQGSSRADAGVVTFEGWCGWRGGPSVGEHAAVGAAID